MRIGLLGGTGDIGEGLALRWGRDTDHEILIGSRDPERARDAAESYEETLADHGLSREIGGFANEMTADRGDMVVVCVPPYHVASTVDTVHDRLRPDDVVVTPAAGIQRDDEGFHYHPPSAGSVTRLVADAVPERVPVVGAFHNLAAGRLADLNAELGIDTLVVGDDADAKTTTIQVAEEISGLRALDAGGIANAPEVESLTPLLINIARENEGLQDLGVRFE